MPIDNPVISGHDAAPTMTTPPPRILAAAAAALTALVLASGVAPYDRITWAMEVAPVLIALPLMVATHRRFPLTTLLYLLVFAHAVVLIAGGAWSYARVPLGFWIADVFDMDRNPYDKIGHFMQGFVPAIVAREIFLRGAYVQGRRMLAFLSICVVMMVSSCYELIEWGAALALGQGADEFLGTQGYAWDTQSDMFFALIGSCTAIMLLSTLHDRQIAGLPARA